MVLVGKVLVTKLLLQDAKEVEIEVCVLETIKVVALEIDDVDGKMSVEITVAAEFAATKATDSFLAFSCSWRWIWLQLPALVMVMVLAVPLIVLMVILEFVLLLMLASSIILIERGSLCRNGNGDL